VRPASVVVATTAFLLYVTLMARCPCPIAQPSFREVAGNAKYSNQHKAACFFVLTALGSSNNIIIILTYSNNFIVQKFFAVSATPFFFILLL
jgi:hypothetical protein